MINARQAPNDSSNFPLALDELGPGAGPQQGITATFDLGPEVNIADAVVGPAGGSIAGFDGLTIAVPPDAHGVDTPYQVTSRAIDSHDLPAELDVVSPLYRIDNGGVLSERAIEVDVPISIPSGEFAMGFFYDGATGEFEGMPIVSIDDDSVVLGTRHFSEFVIIWNPGMAIGQLPVPVITLPDPVIDTGFRPGVDDWHFENRGSAPEIDGHCSGQSLSAMWYFTEQKAAGGASLNGRFDNTDADPMNALWPGTSGLWQDDRDGYRLATAVQSAQYAGGFGAYEFSMLESSRDLHFGGRDALTYSAFGMAMWITHEPQFVGVDEWVDNGDGVWVFEDDYAGGHAMIVYGATEQGLYVADPNHPGMFRWIRWYPDKMVSANVTTPGVLGPFDSAAKAGDPTTTFNVIAYSAKTALVDWADLAGLWPDFVDGTVGNNVFPGYTTKAVYTDADGVVQTKDIHDRLVVSLDKLDLTIDVPGEVWRMSVYEGDQLSGTAEHGATESVAIALEEGDNDFGVYVEVARTSGNPPQSEWAFVDFDRLVITRGSGLTLEMVPDESEAAALQLLVKDAPVLVENPDVPGEIVAITASYKAGPAEQIGTWDEAAEATNYEWVVVPAVADDICMGAGWGGADAGFGPNLCIDVRLSLWDGDPSPFDPALVRTEALDVNPTPDPCLVQGTGPTFPDDRITQFPCVDSVTANVDLGVEIFGFDEEDRNLGVSRYVVRAVAGEVRIDISTSYRNYYGADQRTDRMREVVTTLINDIAQNIGQLSTE